jgi:hypothetical protein
VKKYGVFIEQAVSLLVIANGEAIHFLYAYKIGFK